MLINSFDMKTLCDLLNRQQVVNQVNPNYITRLMPNAGKAIFMGKRGLDARTIVVDAAVSGSSRANMYGVLDAIKARVNKGLLTIVFSDNGGRQIQGYGFVDGSEIPPEWVQLTVPIKFVFVCPDPRWRDVSQTILGSSNPHTLTPLGNARMPLVIKITGNNATPATNPTVTYKNSSGATIASFTWTGTLTGSETLVIDTEFFSVKKNGTNVISTFSGDFFDANPEDYDFASSAWPTITLGLTAGTHNDFHAEFYRRWL